MNVGLERAFERIVADAAVADEAACTRARALADDPARCRRYAMRVTPRPSLPRRSTLSRPSSTAGKRNWRAAGQCRRAPRSCSTFFPPAGDMPLDDRLHWLLRVTDFISGMTDCHAVKQYRLPKGLLP